MPEPDIVRFRAQADDCRQYAERAISPIDKEFWLRLSVEWTKMARTAELLLRRE